MEYCTVVLVLGFHLHEQNTDHKIDIREEDTISRDEVMLGPYPHPSV